MQTLTSNSALTEVPPVGVVVLSIAPAIVLPGGLLPGGLVANPVKPLKPVVTGEVDEMLDVWEDTAPSRCSPLDDF